MPPHVDGPWPVYSTWVGALIQGGHERHVEPQQTWQVFGAQNDTNHAIAQAPCPHVGVFLRIPLTPRQGTPKGNALCRCPDFARSRPLPGLARNKVALQVCPLHLPKQSQGRLPLGSANGLRRGFRLPRGKVDIAFLRV